MAVHSVRQIKNNPSDLFRELERGEVAVLTRYGKPVGVAVPFSLVLDVGAQAALATHLLAEGAISLGAAANMAARSVEDYLDLLRRTGLDDVLYDTDRLEEDIATIDAL